MPSRADAPASAPVAANLLDRQSVLRTGRQLRSPRRRSRGRQAKTITGFYSASAIAARRTAAANYRQLRATLRQLGGYF
jgi:hypothetical protein